MKRWILLLFVPLVAFCQSPVDNVRPQIDTHKSRWFFFASACRPFGMVALSPDTGVRGSWNSGYLYKKAEVLCFSHIHCWQLAGIPAMPTTGEVLGHKGMEAAKSAFSHDTEVVKPGYHKLRLDRYGIDVELTSTTRVGMHRYTFPTAAQANVLFDVGAYLAHGGMQRAAIRKVSDTEVRGYAVMAPTMRRAKPVKVWFVAAFDTPFATFGGWEKQGEQKVLVRKEALEGKEVGGFVTFDRPIAPIQMKVAISYVSEEQAALNLAEELPHWDFARVKEDSFAEWNRELGKITVKGGTEAERIKFYTDLWHALLGRHIFSDINGKYLDNTGKAPRVCQVPLKEGKPVRNTHNTDGFWGSEFNLNILWALAYPKVMSDMVSTLVDYHTNGGMIARGPSGGDYTYVMAGDNAIPMIAAAYNKGIRDFDVEAAYAGCLKNSEPGGIRDHTGYSRKAKPLTQVYIERGYVPEKFMGGGFHQGGCSLTLYFAYQDWCMAQLAKGMGREDVYKKYQARSGNYRNVWDAEVGWMRPREVDGSWMRDFAPIAPNAFTMPGFIESNAAIFTYYVPHDIPGLIRLIGGNAAFIAKLNKQFETAAPGRFIASHGNHSKSWVDYENQPSLHMAHLFSHAGAPWLTQYWVRRVKRETFGGITPFDGYNGDEDQGQMGALGVLMAIGLFDVQGGAAVNPQYEITTPLFDEVTIALAPRYYPGKTFTIRTSNNAPENVYIQSAKLNGKPLNDFRIPHATLVQGGLLELELGPKPNKAWGATHE